MLQQVDQQRRLRRCRNLAERPLFLRVLCVFRIRRGSSPSLPRPKKADERLRDRQERLAGNLRNPN